MRAFCCIVCVLCVRPCPPVKLLMSSSQNPHPTPLQNSQNFANQSKNRQGTRTKNGEGELGGGGGRRVAQGGRMGRGCTKFLTDFQNLKNCFVTGVKKFWLRETCLVSSPPPYFICLPFLFPSFVLFLPPSSFFFFTSPLPCCLEFLLHLLYFFPT